jgi:hypothetical protein
MRHKFRRFGAGRLAISGVAKRAVTPFGGLAVLGRSCPRPSTLARSRGTESCPGGTPGGEVPQKAYRDQGVACSRLTGPKRPEGRSVDPELK